MLPISNSNSNSQFPIGHWRLAFGNICTLATFLALFALFLPAALVAGEQPAPRQSPVVAIPDYLQTNEVVSAKRSITENLLAAGAAEFRSGIQFCTAFSAKVCHIPALLTV